MSKSVLLNSDIVEGCRQNQSKAQMQLYDLYCEAMYRIAQRYIRDDVEAEDVMQDAFIKVFKNIKHFKGEVTIGAWIKRIVINQCIDYLKKKKIELISLDEREMDVADDWDWSVAEQTNVQNITAAINKLPEKYKVVLNMYLIEGYDHQEIAQVLNISEVNSRSQLMRGKNKLRSQLKRYNYA
jgi:RNA polymerase sigma-70 factor (ECF subfamily)